MAERVELIWRTVVEGERQLEAVRNALRGARVEVQQTSAAVREAEGGFRSLAGSLEGSARSMTGAVVAGAALSAGLFQVGRFLKSATVDAALYAARVETLGVVTSTLARVNDLNVNAVQSLEGQIKSLGITTEAARDTINQMIIAQLDLGRAVDVARLAQNAAVVGLTDSSEALQRIIFGTVTRQVEVLRRVGIIISFEQEFARAARELGRPLSEAEKSTVAFNAVLREGAKVTGAYEAAMETAGKQIGSLSRFVAEAKLAFGEGFLPEVRRAVGGLTELLKAARENADVLQDLARAIVVAGGAFATFSALRIPAVLGQFGKLQSVLRAFAAAGPASLLGALGTGAFLVSLENLQKLEDRLKAFTGTSADVLEMRQEFDRLFEGIAAGTEKIDALGEAMQRFRSRAGGREVIESLRGGPEAIIGSAAFREFGRRRFGEGFLDALLPTQLAAAEKGDKVARAFIAALVSRFEAEREGLFGGADIGIPAIKFISGTAPAIAEAARLRTEAAKQVEAFEKRAIQISQQAQIQAAEGVARVRIQRQLELETIQAIAAELEHARRLEGAAAAGQEAELGRLNRAAAQVRAAFAAIARFEFAQQVARLQQAARGALPEVPEPRGPRTIEQLTESFQADLKARIQADEEAVRRAKEGVEALDRLAQERFQREEATLRQEEQFRARRIELLTRPGGEREALQQTFQLRLDIEQAVFDRSSKNEEALARLRFNLARAVGDFQLGQLEIQRRRLDEFREAAGRIFDAFQARGARGLSDFARQFLTTIQRQIFVNLAGVLFERLGRVFGGGGQQQGQQQPRGRLGRILDVLLAGTPFGRGGGADTAANTAAVTASTQAAATLAAAEQQAAAATQQQITKTDELILEDQLLRDALERLRVAIEESGGKLVPGGGAGFLGGFGGPGGFGGGGQSPFVFGAFGDERTIGQTLRQKGPQIAFGGLQVYQGIRRGGAGGKTQAVGGGLLAAAPFTGPAEPFVAAAGAILVAIGGLIGTSQGALERRQDEITRTIEAARFTAPSPATLFAAGRTPLDVDFQGNIRRQPQVVINVSAIDAKSFIDRGPQIAEGIRLALGGGAAPALRAEIRRAAFGA